MHRRRLISVDGLKKWVVVISEAVGNISKWASAKSEWVGEGPKSKSSYYYMIDGTKTGCTIGCPYFSVLNILPHSVHRGFFTDEIPYIIPLYGI
jgi:hypothetical protein